MYKMVDGVRQNKRHPETFSVPNRGQKVAVKVQDYVKIGFIVENGTHRMWVSVTKIEGRKYFGILHNEPMGVDSKILKYGDKVEFESRHILDIIPR